MESRSYVSSEEAALREALFFASNRRHGAAMDESVRRHYSALAVHGQGNSSLAADHERVATAIRLLLKANSASVVF